MNLNKNSPSHPRRLTVFRDADKIEHMLYRPLAISISVAAILFVLITYIGMFDLAFFSEEITNYVLRNEEAIAGFVFRTPVVVGLMAFIVGAYRALTTDTVVSKDYLKLPLSLYVISRAMIFVVLSLVCGAATFCFAPVILIIAGALMWTIFLKDLSQVIFDGVNNNLLGITALLLWPLMMTTILWLLRPFFRIPRETLE